MTERLANGPLHGTQIVKDQFSDGSRSTARHFQYEAFGQTHGVVCIRFQLTHGSHVTPEPCRCAETSWPRPASAVKAPCVNLMCCRGAVRLVGRGCGRPEVHASSSRAGAMPLAASARRGYGLRAAILGGVRVDPVATRARRGPHACSPGPEPTCRANPLVSDIEPPAHCVNCLLHRHAPTHFSWRARNP